MKPQPVINVTLWEVSVIFTTGKENSEIKIRVGTFGVFKAISVLLPSHPSTPEKTGEGGGRGAEELAWGVSDSHPSSS